VAVSSSELTGEALDCLLSFLDQDREQAARRYQTMYRKLLHLFEWRGCAFPDELADETINRVAKKLSEGTEIQAEDPYRYFAGVAHWVFMEVIRKEKQERRALAEVRHLPPSEPIAGETERRLTCLDRCLDQLPADNRELIVQFYQGDGGARISHRKHLAEQLGITLNALRIRAHRLRMQLESCVRSCLEADAK
jgi:DNA-directed RNA polymerase specialized sigma24 family protein